MQSWEFQHHVEPSHQRWTWRAVNRDGSTSICSPQAFDSFTKAFEDAKSCGFDQKTHKWNLVTPEERSPAVVDAARVG